MIDPAAPWVNIVFIQDWDSYAPIEALEGDVYAIAEYLSDWDYGKVTDADHDMCFGNEELSAGAYDDVVEVTVDGIDYVLTHNPAMGHVGLSRRPVDYWPWPSHD